MNKLETLVTAGLKSIGILAAGPERRTIETTLRDRGFETSCLSLQQLIQAIGSGTLSAVLVTEEVLATLDIEAVSEAIRDQPAWSDFPFLLLIARSAVAEHAERIEALGHVAIVERPLDATVVVNAVRAALRSRERQVESKHYVHQREQAEEQLRLLTVTLESRVKVRMAELRAAHDRLTHEVAERRAAEERLRESEELHRHTLELSQQLVWTAAPDGAIESTSSGFWKLTGLPLDQNPSMAVHPDDRDGFLSDWRASVASGEPFHHEFRMMLAHGNYRYFRARAAPRRDSDGRLVRWYGTTEDIHEQKQAEAALQIAEERYRLVARSTNDVVWDLDVAKHEIHWSQSATNFFGYMRRDTTTTIKWWTDRVHPDQRERVAASLYAAIRGTGNNWSEAYRFRKADGDYADVLDRGYIIRSSSGEPLRMVGAITDITERNRAEDEITRMQSELIHVSRVSAMGAMGSTLAHELNQPLTAVANYVRGSRRMLAGVEFPQSDIVREGLEAAEAGTLRAGQIVRRLRELVAKGNVRFRIEELGKIIQDASVVAFVDEHLMGISHRVEIEPGARWVEADAIQVQQVLINLIRNAVQALADRPKREVLISARPVSGGMVEVSVEDSGAGLPPEVHAALFTPFQSSKSDGMGIGLSISRTIVEAHGGNIWAENREEGGAAFRFTLPRAEEPSLVAPHSAEQAPSE